MALKFTGGKAVPRSGPQMVAGQRAQAINSKAYALGEMVRSPRVMGGQTTPGGMARTAVGRAGEVVRDAERSINRAYIRAQSGDDLGSVETAFRSAKDSLERAWPVFEDQNHHDIVQAIRDLQQMLTDWLRDVKAGRIA